MSPHGRAGRYNAIIWHNAGIGGPGVSAMTFHYPEHPLRGAYEVSLSDILETEEDWLRRNPGKSAEDFTAYMRLYFLSAKAARGILQRAERHGVELPLSLRKALERAAHGMQGASPAGAAGAEPPIVAIPIQAVRGEEGGEQLGPGVQREGDPMYTLHAAGQHMVGVGRKKALAVDMGGGKGQARVSEEVAPILTTGAAGHAVAHALRSEGADASEDGTGRGTPVIAMDGSETTKVGEEITPALRSGRQGGISGSMEIRRLTPTECERLQAFPDGWTEFGADGKRIPDSVRYRMLGNAVCTSVVYWIGVRMLAFHEGRGPDVSPDLRAYIEGLNSYVPGAVISGRGLTFGSVFTGIGGFDLGLERVREWAGRNGILSRHRLIKRYGDIRKVKAVDLIAGGFPCQDLSVAGKRRGLAGERSRLFFEFMRVVGEVRPRWVLIENVPGLLSSSGGQDMETVLRTLRGLGYWWAYRVLDARYFGVAQRRRRVFIVGDSQTRSGAASVLLERESQP